MLTAPQFSPAGLVAVRTRIADAARRAGRDPAVVRLVGVSKQQPAERVRAACEAGLTEFGENYVQEAMPKIAALRELGIDWHFIGHLQANKTRDVATRFAWVHSVDRLRIAARLNEQRPHRASPLQVLIEVRLDAATGKGGVEPEAAAGLAAAIAQMPRLRLRGLMCIPEPSADVDSQRLPYRRLRALLEELNRGGCALDTLSMGMSGDFEAAIAEGATIVRVGTAIFGART
jgi:pyridoxal phosphate enzyme (YggS family)